MSVIKLKILRFWEYKSTCETLKVM